MVESEVNMYLKHLKRPLDTPKRMIERRRERERYERYREGGRDERVERRAELTQPFS